MLIESTAETEKWRKVSKHGQNRWTDGQTAVQVGYLKQWGWSWAPASDTVRKFLIVGCLRHILSCRITSEWGHQHATSDPPHFHVTITTQHQIPSPPYPDVTITKQRQIPPSRCHHHHHTSPHNVSYPPLPISISPSRHNVSYPTLPISMSPSFPSIAKLVTKSLAQRPSYHSNNDKLPFPWHVDPRLEYFSCLQQPWLRLTYAQKCTLPMKKYVTGVTDNIKICSGTISNVTILNVW